jgi:glutathione S-transferase
MALQLYFHPHVLDGPGPASREWEKLWPMKRFPVLVDGDHTIKLGAAPFGGWCSP